MAQNEIMKPVRYYHYLSATKVDMIYNQAAPRRWGRSAEMGAGVPGVIQGKVGVTAPNSDPTMFEKLAVIEEQINRLDPPGAASWGESYIRDRMKLYSAIIEKEQDDGSDTVLFAGVMRNGLAVVLGGSAAHMLLSPGALMRMTDSSFRQVRRAVGLAAQRWRNLQGDVLVEDGVVVAERPGDPFVASDTFMLDYICYIARTAGESSDFTPMGYCEFLAKVVCRPDEEFNEDEDAYHDPWRGPKRGVLATPLYVAHLEANEPPPPAWPDPWPPMDGRA